MKRVAFFQRLTLMLCLMLTSVLVAQEDDIGSRLQAGTSLTGRLNDANPRVAYFFEGTRGEVIRVNLQPTSGNLDPVMSIFDNTGNLVMSRDDSDGGLGVDTRLTLPNDGRYYIIIGRWGYALGTTSGEYALSIERLGTTSLEGSTLRYGIPVTNAITNVQPQVYYTFRAQAGDIIDVDMVRSSGTLDPFVQVVDRNRFVIAENDDLNPQTRNAGIRSLVILETGTYIIVATRYGEAAGETVGSFVLTVSEASNSGLGNSNLAPATIFVNQPITGTLNDRQPARYYTFEAQRDDIFTITLDRISGNLDPYLILANAGLQTMTEDDDGGAGRNARIQQFRVPAGGIYYIIAQRYDGEQGTTSGDYRLLLTYEGNAFDGIDPTLPRLLYGTTLQDTLSDAKTESRFVFWGQTGERVTIGMNRAGGDLNPVLELLNADGARLVRDENSGGGNNARISAYTLPYTGVYIIRAMRYDGEVSNPNTSGAYNLIFTRELD